MVIWGFIILSSVLLRMLENFQNKTLSKMQKVQASVSSSSLPKPPILLSDILGSFSACFPRYFLVYSQLHASREPPHCLNPRSWHFDKNPFLTPDGITASSAWSCQHIFSGTWFLDVAAIKPTEIVWLAPLEQVFPILMLSAIWACCFQELRNNSRVRISQSAVHAFRLLARMFLSDGESLG